MKVSDTVFVHVDDDSGSSINMDEVMLLYITGEEGQGDTKKFKKQG